MSELAKKLGIKSGYRLCLLGASPAVKDLLLAQMPPAVSLADDFGEGRFDLILFWPKSLQGLADQFDRLAMHILPDGAIWVVMPKKKYASAQGVEFRWEQMQSAGLQGDLVDNKIASVSAEEYATRFVIRKERRSKYR